MKSNWRQLDYNELYVPPVLYKYRTWGNEWHKTILTDKTLFLSPPSKFEDPLDCKVPDRYDLLTDEDLFQRFLKKVKEDYPFLSDALYQRVAEYGVKNTPLKDPIKNKQNQEEIFKAFDRQIGVLCLTANPQNFEMWDKYADKSKGFCVGFHGKELFSDHERFGFTGDVDYVDVLPIIHPNEEMLDKAFKKVFSKLKKWEFEQEYRTTKLLHKPSNDDWRTVPVDEKKYAEIIFGDSMSETDKDEISKLVKGNFSNVKLRQAEIDAKNRTVTIKDLV